MCLNKTPTKISSEQFLALYSLSPYVSCSHSYYGERGILTSRTSMQMLSLSSRTWKLCPKCLAFHTHLYCCTGVFFCKRQKRLGIDLILSYFHYVNWTVDLPLYYTALVAMVVLHISDSEKWQPNLTKCKPLINNNNK